MPFEGKQHCTDSLTNPTTPLLNHSIPLFISLNDDVGTGDAGCHRAF